MTVTRSRLTKKAATVTESLRVTVQGLGPVYVRLPLPPTLNHLRTPVRGRLITSPEYRAWIATAGAELLIQRPNRIEGRVGIAIHVAPPKTNRRRDLDNVGFKAILDLLVTHGVIEGDDSRYVRHLEASWDDIAIEPGVRVIIKPAIF